MSFESRFDLVPLGSLAKFINGDRGENYPKPTDYVVEGIPFLSATDVGEGKIAWREAKKISPVSYSKLRSGQVQRGDLLFCLRGSLGKLGYVENDLKGAIASSLVILRASNESIARYLRFVLGSAGAQGAIKSLDNGSVQGNISAAALKSLMVPNPPEDIRTSITAVLESVDRRIDLNRRINQTLEAMAQAIFKSWFVDFDPVKAKIAAIQQGRDPLRAAMTAISGKSDAELDTLPPEQYEQLAATAALFPDEMEESELGEIPRGWEIELVGNYLQTISKTFPLKTKEEAIFLNTGDIQDGVYLHKTKSKVATLPGQAKKSIQLNDILYSEIRPENKRFAYVYFDADDYVVSTKLMVLRSKGAIDPKFLYFFLRQKNVIDQLQLLAESRSGTFPQITFDVLSTIEFVAPKDHQVTNFFAETIVSQVMKVTNSNIAENNKLAELRDTLLPKLLSGELSVSVATELAESAGAT